MDIVLLIVFAELLRLRNKSNPTTIVFISPVSVKRYIALVLFFMNYRSTKIESKKNRNLVVRRTAILYGLALAALVLVLKLLQYKYLVRDLSIEFYMGALAVVFTAVGAWAGLKLTKKKTIVVNQPVPLQPFALDPTRLEKLGISKREHEVLEGMAAGLSNQEIADRMFVSLNTVKTHSANLFSKLDVKRRTQAIQKGKELLLIP